MKDVAAQLEADYEDEGDEDQESAERARILDALAIALAETRTEAIEGRSQSGIEAEWLEDEEHYEGIDDANRGEMSAWRSKPLGQAALRSDDDQGSTVFFNITRPYCDAGAARVGDMLLPTDDRGWSIKPTPVPELLEISEGKVPDRVQKQVGEAFPDDPEMAAQTTQELVDEVKKEMDEAKDRAYKAEKQIDDWHVECQYHAEMRLVIEDAARIGSGVLKGPIPHRKKQVAFKDGALVVNEELVPTSQRVDYWNCFPDSSCGKSIHNGAYFWERDDITGKALRALKDQPGYLADQIDACLKEGAHKAVKEIADGGRNDLMGLVARDTKNLFEIWYYYGDLSREQIESAGCECPDQDMVPAMITMVNNHVIKATLNPLDTGEFPYDIMVWQQRSGLPWGMGIARQIRTPQRIVNAAARNMMDNAGLAGGAMWIYNQGLVTPIDGIHGLAPRKGWMVSEDADVDDVRKAFSFIEIPMRQQELEAIIMLGLKMAEDVTGLPMLLQGQQGNAPDTVGGMKILNDNAGAPLRRLARLFDDLVTEPHVRRYYSYLLQYGEDDAKGDFSIDARGSSALVERDLNNQAIMEMGQIVTNPVFGLDPKKWIIELLKSQRLDPKRFEYDDDEWKKLVEQMAAQSQQGDSSIEVATIRAQTDMQKAQLTSQDKAADREYQIALESLKREKEEQDREVLIALEALQREMSEMQMSQSSSDSDKKIRADLAKTVMKLKAQIELARSTGKTPQVATPPTEPPGRAPNGQAFQK